MTTTRRTSRRRGSPASPGGGVRATKQSRVYDYLREAILACELPPGERIVAETVADTLSVSVIPVREALNLLRSERLVEIEPHVGATVAPIGTDAVEETFSVLEGLELAASRVAAQRMTRANFVLLEGILADMEAALPLQDNEQWAALNRRFHLSIAEATGMPMLCDMLGRGFDQWDRIRRCFFNGVVNERVELSQREHRQMLDALERRAFDELAAVVSAHSRGALDAYLRHMADVDRRRGRSAAS